jgi:hypothetical protein
LQFHWEILQLEFLKISQKSIAEISVNVQISKMNILCCKLVLPYTIGERIWFYSVLHILNRKSLWLWSTSKLCRPIDRRFLAK